jgi:predicted ribonuclease YlaK
MSLAAVPGKIVIYDTNSLMHYLPPNQIDWTEVFGKPLPLRLVVPLCVVAELDDKAHIGSEEMALRARSASKAIRAILQGAPAGKAVPVVNTRPSRQVVTTLEVLPEEVGHNRFPQVDDEIIDRAKFLAGIVGQTATILTHDYNMELRAQAAGVDVAQLPEKYKKTRSAIRGVDNQAAVKSEGGKPSA